MQLNNMILNAETTRSDLMIEFADALADAKSNLVDIDINTLVQDKLYMELLARFHKVTASMIRLATVVAYLQMHKQMEDLKAKHKREEKEKHEQNIGTTFGTP